MSWAMLSASLSTAAAVAFGYHLGRTVERNGTGVAPIQAKKLKRSQAIRPAVFAAVVAVVLGYCLSLPSVVVPPHVPQDSPTKTRLRMPPWPIFKPAMFLMDLNVRIQRLLPPEVRITLLAGAYSNSAVLYALTRHNIIDSIGWGHPKTCSQVAQELDLKEHAVCQFTRAGKHLGILKQARDGILTLTRHGAIVHSDDPNSLRDLVLALNEGIFEGWRGATTKSIKTGQSGIKEATGLELWEYYNKHPEDGKQFDSFMKGNSFNQLGAILSSWRPPSESITFCDIGGGMGHSAVQFLDHYPGASGIVFDRAEIIGRTNKHLAERGLSGRAQALGGDIFQPFPKELASCDVYFMKYIMHDWEDESASTILKNVKEVAKPGAKLVLVDVVLDNGEGLFLDLSGSLCSVNMMAASPFGAKERTLSEFSDLLVMSGYKKEPKLLPTRELISVIEVDC